MGKFMPPVYGTNKDFYVEQKRRNNEEIERLQEENLKIDKVLKDIEDSENK